MTGIGTEAVVLFIACGVRLARLPFWLCAFGDEVTWGGLVRSARLALAGSDEMGADAEVNVGGAAAVVGTGTTDTTPCVDGEAGALPVCACDAVPELTAGVLAVLAVACPGCC